MNLIPICSRNFPGISSLMFSLVEDPEPKSEWSDKYFLFIKAVPSTQNSNSSTGRSYDHKRSINFKATAEKALSFAYALKILAEGKGKHYDDIFGNFSMFADSSKSQFAQGGGLKKSMQMNYYMNNKTNKQVISIGFKSGEEKVNLYFTPYEAYSASVVLERMANMALDLIFKGPNIKVNNNNNNYNKPAFPQQQPVNLPQPNNFNNNTYQQQNLPPSNVNTQAINQVADNFAAMMNMDDPFAN